MPGIKEAELKKSQEYTGKNLASLLLWDAVQAGGPRDRQFRRNILQLVITYQCIGIKSELLENELLKILDDKVLAALEDLRQVAEHVGIALP